MIEEIKKALADNDCGRLVWSSGYSDLNETMLSLGKFEDVIEIGTHNGLSTAVLTHYSRRVFTFDIALRNAEFVWNLLGVRNKISSYVSSYPDAIRSEIEYIKRDWKDINFNFAFIDGSHEYYGVKNDFEMVKFCGKVLLHDYDIGNDIRALCNEIGAERIGHNIAYWERK